MLVLVSVLYSVVPESNMWPLDILPVQDKVSMFAACPMAERRLVPRSAVGESLDAVNPTIRTDNNQVGYHRDSCIQSKTPPKYSAVHGLFYQQPSKTDLYRYRNTVP